MTFFGYHFGLVSLLIVAAQIFFGVHAAKTGRYYWIFLILFIPALGCIIYFIAEYLPEVRGGERARRVAGRVADTVTNTLDPGKRVRELEARLKMTPSFANRHALAEAYLDADRVDEAIALFTENTRGVHAQDPSTMRGLAHAWFKKGELEKSRECILAWRKKKESTLSNDMDLLYAMVLERLGELEAAVAEYRAIAKKAGSEEARYRAGAILKGMGREGEAAAEFEEILRNADAFGAAYAKAQRNWVELARRELK